MASMMHQAKTVMAADAAVRAVCPDIDGISIGDLSDPASWVVSFRESASRVQRAAAEQVLMKMAGTYQINRPTFAEPVDGTTFLARLTDAEYAAITSSNNIPVRRWLDIFRVRGDIDVNSAATQAVKAGLVSLGLLTQRRADEIFQP